MAGNIRLKEMTGAEVMVMAEDVPLLERMGTEASPQPVDRVLQDGDPVTLGGTTLTARLTPGHTPGTTTWVMTADEGENSYGVVILGGGVTARSRLAGNPELQDQFTRMFEVNRSLTCDIPLGPHTPMYRMEEKYARLGGGPNPFIDPASCEEEMFLQEQSFRFRLEEQQREPEEN
jgi:metallo-beta-lactamase class B